MRDNSTSIYSLRGPNVMSNRWFKSTYDTDEKETKSKAIVHRMFKCLKQITTKLRYTIVFIVNLKEFLTKIGIQTHTNTIYYFILFIIVVVSLCFVRVLPSNWFVADKHEMKHLIDTDFILFYTNNFHAHRILIQFSLQLVRCTCTDF